MGYSNFNFEKTKHVDENIHDREKYLRYNNNNSNNKVTKFRLVKVI